MVPILPCSHLGVLLLICVPPRWLVLLCYPVKVLPFSKLLYPARNRASKPALMTPGPVLLTVSGSEGQVRDSITPEPIPPQSSGMMGPFGAGLPTPLPLGPAPLCCLGKIYDLLPGVLPPVRGGGQYPRPLHLGRDRNSSAQTLDIHVVPGSCPDQECPHSL